MATGLLWRMKSSSPPAVSSRATVEPWVALPPITATIGAVTATPENVVKAHGIGRRPGLSGSIKARRSTPSLADDADDAAVVEEGVGLQAEDPSRLGELGGERGERRGARRARRFVVARPAVWVVDPVEVPPSAAVAEEVQPAVGAPGRLHDALGGAAGDAARSAEPGGRQLRDPQLSAVPRHLRVIPAQPGEHAPVGAHARGGVEVVAGGQHADLSAI